MIEYLEELKKTVQQRYDRQAEHMQSVPVKEIVEGKIVWEGEVVKEEPKSKALPSKRHNKNRRVTAWSVKFPGWDSKWDYRSTMMFRSREEAERKLRRLQNVWDDDDDEEESDEDPASEEEEGDSKEKEEEHAQESGDVAGAPTSSSSPVPGQKRAHPANLSHVSERHYDLRARNAKKATNN